MKKRNKQFLKEKEFINLKRQLSNNRDIQYNLGFYELPVPIFIGYQAFLEPRADIQNRQDAWVFWYISENFSTKLFSKKIENFSWNQKNPKHLDKLHLNGIYENTYIKLPEQIKKWFTEDTFSWRKTYYCTVPDFYFDISYKKAYKTKIPFLDNILKQEEHEIKSKLINYGSYYDDNCPKHFRKTLNRKQRAKSKQILYNIVYKNKDIEFVDNYRDANWLWW